MKDFMSLSTKELYSFDAFELDPARRVLLHNEEPVTLTPKAFEVLSYLVFNPERVVTKEELLKAIWPDSFVEEGNLPQYISALRKALGEKSCLIVTVPGRGYQFGAQVTATQVPVAPIESHPAMGEGALFEQRPGDILVQRVRERSTRVVYEDVPAAQPDPALQLAGATASRAKIWRWTAIAALVGVLIALAIFGWKRAHPPQISDVVLADFTNNTGDAIASFLNGAVTHAERSEQPVIVVISLKEGTISADGGDGYVRRFEMPQGIILDRVLPEEVPPGVADAEDPAHADRQILLLPGGVAPAIGVEYFNHHGARRRVQLDPMTGFPHVENVSKE